MRKRGRRAKEFDRRWSCKRKTFLFKSCTEAD